MARGKAKLILSLIIIIAVIGVFTYQHNKKDNSAEPTGSLSQSSSPPVDTSSNDGFDKKKYSLDDPTSPWVIVNKKRPLPDGFIPPNLQTVGGEQMQAAAADALNELMQAAASEQAALKAISGYRSYSSQKSVYENYVKSDGQAAADTYSARPGYSEHQTGLAIDVGSQSGECDLEICFANTVSGRWIEKNAYKYGFVIRYYRDKTPITGYQYEPWHLRYVGRELAAEIQGNNQTLEEFFGLPAAPNY